MFRTWWQKFFSFPRNRFSRRRGYRPPNSLTRRTFRLSMTALEDRVTPATFVDNGTTLNLVLNTANTNAAIISNGTSYTITLTGDTWTGTDDANVTGNGTATLTVTTAGIAAFTNQISLTDAAAGGDSVTFNDSFVKPYANNFNINLSNAAAGGISFNGQSNFGTSSISASTTHNIVVNSAATLATGSGNLTLSANEQLTPTSGNFFGVVVDGTIQSTSSGVVSVSGRGGNDAFGQQYGVLVNAGGQILGGTSGMVVVSGTGGASAGSGNVGVLVTNTTAKVSSAGAAVQVTGQGGGTGVSGGNDGVEVGSQGTISAGGAGTVTVNGTGGATTGTQDYGVFVTGLGGQVTSGGGSVTVTGAGGGGAVAVEVDGGGLISSGGNANVTVIGDSMGLFSANSVNAGTGVVTLQQKSLGTGITLGTNVAGTLSLTDAELGTITAGILRIGNSGSGNITVSAPITTHAGYNTLSLTSGAAVTDNAAADTISVTNLAVRAVNGINLDTAVSNLAATDSDVSASGNIRVINTGALTLPAGPTGVDGLAAVTRSGGSLGSITLVAASPLTVNAPVTDNTGGDITLTAGAANSNNAADVLTINANVTATGGNGSITLNGNSLVVNTATVSAAGAGNVTANFGGTGGTATFNNGATVSAANGNITVTSTTATTLNGNAKLATANGIVTLNIGAGGTAIEAATATISGNQLLLLGTGAGASFALGTSTTNKVNTIAGAAAGAINYQNSAALTVGTVNGTVGVTTTNSPVTLTTLAGDITVGVVNAGTGPVTIHAAGSILDGNGAGTLNVTGGAITLTAGGANGINLDVITSTPATAGVTATTTNAPIVLRSSSQLQVDNINAGNGSVTLHVTNANTATSSITSLHPNDNVADVTGGAVTLTADGPTTGNTGQIGFFNAAPQFFEVAATTLTAVTNNSRLWMSAIGGTAINQVTAGTNTAFLRTFNGTLTSTHTVPTPDIIAATVNLSQAPGAVSGAFGTAANPLLTQTSSLTARITAGLGSINVANVAAGGSLTVTGASTAGGDATICALGGDINLTGALNVGAGTARLQAAGAVTQTAAGRITADTLGVVATGPITLDQAVPPNHVTNVVALNTGGEIDFQDDSSFKVGAVTAIGCFGGAAGIGGNSVTVCSPGDITLTAPVAAGGGTARIQAGGNVTQTGTGTITAVNLGVRANGNIALYVPGAPNAVTGVFAADTTGGPAGSSVNFLDNVGFTVGTVTASDCFTADAVGVQTNNGDVNLVDLTGSISLGQGTAAGTGTVRLQAATGVASTATTGIVTAARLGVRNTTSGDVQLDLANVVPVFAAVNTAVGASIDFRTTGSLQLDAVTSDGLLFTAVNGVTTTGAGGTVRLQESGLTQTAAGIVTTDFLGVRDTGGDVILDQANAVNTFAANNTAAAGLVTLNDAGGLVIGDVEGEGTFTAVSGITTNSGTTYLQAAGNVTQTATGLVNSTGLAVGSSAGGTIRLDQANSVIDFAADETPAGGLINFRTTGGLTLVMLNSGSALLAPIAGVTTNAGTALLHAAGGIGQTATGLVSTGTLGVRNDTTGDVILDQANSVGTFAGENGVIGGGINLQTTTALLLDAAAADGTFAAVNGVNTTGTGGTVRLQEAGLLQTAAGVVNSDLLGVGNANAGDVTLDQPNAVNSFAATNGVAGGRVTFRDAGSLTIGDVTAQGSFAASSGITTNAGAAFLQAGGNVTQTATGLVNAAALGVGSSAGGTIRLDLANAVPTFAANDTVAGGLVSFQTTGGLTLDTVTSGSALLPPIAGVTTNSGTALLHAANGVTQTAVGPVVSSTLAVRNDGTGNINLIPGTNFTALTGNQVGNFAALNGAAGGQVNLATLGALAIGQVVDNGTFAAVLGVNSNNGNSNIQTGTNFAADATLLGTTPASTVLINLGTGTFLLNPGQTGDDTVTLNAEAKAGNFRLGVPQPGDAPPPGAVPPNPAGPAGMTLPANVHRETFKIRPSANVAILVNGNLPSSPPGDTLGLTLTDIGPNPTISFTPGGVGSGRFDFGAARKSILFTGIESVGGLSVAATSIQTGPGTFVINASGTINGQPLTGGVNGIQPPSNPFVVSPNQVNPFVQFGAPRIAFGDFNGDGTSDLIIANGPSSAPLVTVVNGKSLFRTNAAGQLNQSDIVAQFFAYNPNFLGGVFVATGDLLGTVASPDKQVEIITGADAGGGPQVRAFRYTGPAPDINGNFPAYNVFNAVTTFSSPAIPASGFYAYNPLFQGGVRVATGDVNHDGKVDIITGAGPGGGPHVKVFSGANGAVLDSFYAYAPNFAGGVYVAAGDYGSRTPSPTNPGKFVLDGFADIVTGPGLGGGPHVKVFDGAGLSGTPAQAAFAVANPLVSFMAFAPASTNSLFGPNLLTNTGVGSVGLADVNGDSFPDILVATARGPQTELAAFLGNPIVPVDPTRFKFTMSTLGFATVDADGDLLLPTLRDGSNLAGLFGGT